MNLLRRKVSSSPAGTADFDLLRARVEVELSRPAVIVITSSTIEDGQEIVARELARSLATTGSPTLLVDTSPGSRSLSKLPEGFTLEGMANQIVPDSGTGKLAVVMLSDITLQRTTSQRSVQSALKLLRGKFDYVVITAACGASTSFATSALNAADAVLVSVKTGRRQIAADAGLSAALERIDSRFLGVVALDPSIIKDYPGGFVSDAIVDGRRSQTVHVDKDRQRREIAESTT